MPIVSPASVDPEVEISFFWDKYKTEVVAGIVVILIALCGYTAYRFVSDRRDAAASSELASAKTAADYQRVIEKFAGTTASANAYLLLADSQRSEKKYEDANRTLLTFTEKFPKHELITTAWMAVGDNQESAGKADEALSTYQQIVVRYPQSFNAPLALISEVPILQAKGRTEEARRICENLLTNYRDSLFTGEAQRQLRTLRKNTAGVSKEEKAPAASSAATVTPAASIVPKP